MFGDRDAMRRQFAQAWAKHRDGRPLSPLEAQLADIIGAHPEYHDLLASAEAARNAEFPVEAGQTNPFLHMGMHLSIREQISTDRPPGIQAIFRHIATRLGDPLAAEHAMMECLGQALWQAQRSGQAPDEPAYLDCLRRI